MALFLLPVSISDHIEKAMNRFWWHNGAGTGAGVHWLSWQRLCKRKEDGGIRQFNLASLAKTGWNLLTRPQSLVAKLYKARYYADCDLLRAALGANPSYIWKSIHDALFLLGQGCVRRIGDGSDTLVFTDPWLPQQQQPYVQSTNHSGIEELKVSDLI